MVCCKAMATKRTVDNRMTYWFPWKHPMAGRWVLEFGVFDQTPRKWAPRLGPTGLAARSSFLHKTTKAKASARPFGPSHSSLSAPLHENTTQMWARPCGLAFWALQMHQAPIFRPFDVRLAVSDVLRSTPTTPSVTENICCICYCLQSVKTSAESCASVFETRIYQKRCSYELVVLIGVFVSCSVFLLHSWSRWPYFLSFIFKIMNLHVSSIELQRASLENVSKR